MSVAIQPYTGTALDRSRIWSEMPAEELHRRAVKAASEANANELRGLTEAHTVLFGASGSKVSPHTTRAYGAGVDALVAFAGERGVNLLRPSANDGPAFMRWLEERGASSSTQRVRLAAARAVYRALAWAGPPIRDPFTSTKPAKDTTAPWAKRQPYSSSEVDRMVDAATPLTRVLVLLCAHAGMRVSEAVALRWEHLSHDRLDLVVHGKGRKLRRVPVSATLGEALEAIPPSTTGVVLGFLDGAARYRLRMLAPRSEATYRGVHALRHYAGTRLYRETEDLDTVSRFLGHASVDTSRIYAQWSDESLRAAVEAW